MTYDFDNVTLENRMIDEQGKNDLMVELICICIQFRTVYQKPQWLRDFTTIFME